MVIGVADASGKDPLACSAQDVRGWGLHLSHGALYTKHRGTMKGSLSTKQIVPSCAPETPEEDPETGRFVDNVIDIEVEVDMHRRRLSFGLPGTPLVEAPVKLSSAVRPWAYLWNEMDSVQLVSRHQPREGSGGAAAAGRIARTIVQRPAANATAPVPLRSRSDNMLAGPSSARPPLVRVPSHFERGDYLPPYAALDRSPAEAREISRKTAQEVTSVLRSARHAVGLAALNSMRGKSPASKRAPTPPHAPSVYATGDKVVGLAEEYPAEPTRVTDGEAPRTPPHHGNGPASPDTRGMNTAKSSGSALAVSLRSARFASPASYSPRGSPRNTGKGVTHMWDVVKYSTGTYRDVHLQI